jgi:hypothetical protein
MKKLFTMVIIAIMSLGVVTASFAVPQQKQKMTQHLKKDGTQDKRYKEKHIKKDGSLDKRYKENKAKTKVKAKK